MKLAIGYSTKDQVELTMQTMPILAAPDVDIYWGDGSTTEMGLGFFGGDRGTSGPGETHWNDRCHVFGAGQPDK